MRELIKKIKHASNFIEIVYSLLFCFCFLLPVYSYASNNLSPQSNTLILTESKNLKEMKECLSILKETGGIIYHRFPPDSFIGYLPDGSEKKLNKFKRKIMVIRGRSKGIKNIILKSKTANLASKIWERNFAKVSLNSSKKNSAELTDKQQVELNCSGALMPPETKVKKLYPKRSFKGMPYGAASDNTSEFLTGSIAVGLILPESEGNAENWTDEEIETAIAAVQKGLNWLAEKAPSKADISFTYEIHQKVSIPEEPNMQNFDFLNGYKVMNVLGYPGNDLFAQTREYDNDLREKYETNWAITIFLIDITSSTSGKVSVGWIGGPFSAIHFHNEKAFASLVSHEVSHLFYADDEYEANYTPDCSHPSGYLKWKNGNSKKGDCNKYEDCVMREAYRDKNLCLYTRGQIGIIDSDGDGIPDILDTFPATTINIFVSPFSISTPEFNGNTKESPVKNQNPVSSSKPDMTTNVIRKVEYRIDSGGWIEAIPSDGGFDEAEESFTIKTYPLPNGTHILEVRAINSVGNAGDITSINFEINSQDQRMVIEPYGLNFEGTKGGGEPSPKNINLKFINLSGASWQITTSYDWIVSNPSSGIGDSSVSVSINPSSLEIGDYTGKISIKAEGVETQEIPISLFLYGESEINCNLTEINLSGQVIDPTLVNMETFNPPYQNLEIKNPGGNSFNWKSNIDSDWIKLYPDKGEVPSSSLVMLELNGLPRGNYTGNISIESGNGSLSPYQIPVTLDLCEIPSIDQIIPESGPVGTVVKIIGHGFGDIQSDSKLFIKIQEAQVISWSDNEIETEVPENLKEYEFGYFYVKNKCGGGNSRKFTITQKEAPSLSELKPTSLKSEDELILTGSNFGSQAGKVSFVDSANKEFILDSTGITSWGDSKIHVIVPFGMASGWVRVSLTRTDDNKESNETSFTLVKALPQIVSVSPNPACKKSQFTINGKYFGNQKDKVYFHYGDIKKQLAIISWTKDKIIAVAPNMRGRKGTIIVRTMYGRSNKKAFKIKTCL
ncbi:MAG: hypothetical protein A3H37_11250 [Candidatus Schekmanbacteria bacterium RIFCSPLOWO2_02_FULL_38_14]|uniref:IPT/TIG domain-containing protein n=1 Tax=Candidatus Schekmanbacteria bacterium RIFCSPLOWO2_12_FULL_38_15 TaxID=1817883 RepID=A0A1F7SM25_9BACT|nr:MAG: hypothetical protein A3H37_11250 [Candidatus Schekmanbacteria bacterium RIFCSPLOWO2_02_FULL_38_14]OGL54830.1 MAG: hypothetical protein A3G31_01760 [Candidatus Schekmanbacteria bacterium RIFCSPLOWO2_12_FULL_38_15]